jgi:TolB-like protein
MPWRSTMAYAAIANASAQYHQHFEHTPAWIERAKTASQRASMLGKAGPEILVAESWILYAEGKYEEAIQRVRQAIDRKPDVEGGYYLLGRTLFAAGEYQSVADMAEAAVAAAGEDYNIYVPIINALGALGKKEALRNSVLQRIQVLELHLKKVPEDARGRTLLATDYANLGRTEDAMREAHLAMALRPDEAMVMYNVAITEEIISALSALNGLRVAARTSSFAFKGRTADLAEVGAKLNVATVLTGSVRKAGSRLRITAELVNIAEGFQLWSERYERQAEDIFALQDEIAAAIASRLKVSLEAQPEEAARPRTENFDAYQAYLKGRFAINRRGRGLLEGLQLFEHSLALDPDYPLALTGQGDAYALLSFYGYLPAHEAMSKGRAAALRALDRAPGLADAHATLLFISCMYDWDWHSVRRLFAQAMAANRHCVPALQWYALYLALITGEMEEALATARRALEVDPLSAYSHIALNLAFIGARRYEEAEAAARAALELAPDAWIALRNLGITLNLAGGGDERQPVPPVRPARPGQRRRAGHRRQQARPGHPGAHGPRPGRGAHRGEIRRESRGARIHRVDDRQDL